MRLIGGATVTFALAGTALSVGKFAAAPLAGALVDHGGLGLAFTAVTLLALGGLITTGVGPWVTRRRDPR